MTRPPPAPRLHYLYAVVPAGSRAAEVVERESVAGVAGERVHAVVERAVAGVAGEVPAVEFDEEPLNRNLADLQWLGVRAAAHQAVNARLFEEGDALVPLSFGAIFRSRDSLKAMLRARHDDFVARLTQVRGCSEWVITVRRDDTWDEALSESEAMSGLERTSEQSSPGTAYLLRRRAGDVRRREAQRRDAVAIETLLDALEPLAVATHREPLAAVDAAGETVVPPVARLSVLVRRRDESEMTRTLSEVAPRWRREGYAIETSGPWPPYRAAGGPIRTEMAS